MRNDADRSAYITSFLQEVQVESLSPDDPVVVHHTPYPWELVGTGNYAAVFAHPDYPKVVIKLYAPGRSGAEQEIEVYRKLGRLVPSPSVMIMGKDTWSFRG